MYHKNENMAGLTHDKKIIVYLYENTYFENLENTYY